MPIIRYTLRLQDDEFTEEDVFKPRGGNQFENYEAIIREEIIDPLNKNREKLKEPLLELVKIHLVSGCVHLHQWVRVGINKFAERTYYRCARCDISGSIYTKLLDGEIGGIKRDEHYKNKKYDLCRDPLKELPKHIEF